MGRKPKANGPEQSVLDGLRVRTAKGRRPLTKKERGDLLAMLAPKIPVGIEIVDLAPRGSFPARLLRHFRDTDISFALPLMSVITHMASLLTQRGVNLVLPNGSRVRPSIWAIGLAESGSSKTLAFEEVQRILVDRAQVPIAMLPTGSTDAQWLLDLEENNGAFWYQDEVGQFFHGVETSKLQSRMKPWILSAYSGETIANRLKGEEKKLGINDPHFTFLGLTVRSTWTCDVDVRNMSNGLCQRFCYFSAEKRDDKDVYDHLRYWSTDADERRRDDLAGLWAALAAQPGAFEDIALPSEILDWLDRDWWRGLRGTIGRTSLPASFVRRIGHALMQYLPVLHVLLGKAHRPIDLETALLATRYAEWHMYGALSVLQSYKPAATDAVQTVASRYDQIVQKGGTPTPRDIARSLSKAQRAAMGTDQVREICEVLSSIVPVPTLFDETSNTKARSAALVGLCDLEAARFRLAERKRNERRLRDVVTDFQTRAPSGSYSSASTVVAFPDEEDGRSRPAA